MRIRSAQTLVFSRAAGEVVGFNFLTNSTFACSQDLLEFLNYLDDWTELNEVAKHVPTMTPEALRGAVADLVEVNAITEAGSELAVAEDEYRTQWKWGLPSALFHFSVQDKDYMTPEQAETLQLTRAAEGPQPELYLENRADDAPLVPLPEALGGNELLALMAKRRTVRQAASSPVTLSQISDCLFAGLGITGETRNVVGALPLSMTPSGGARNPYEAYVYARDVEGLAPGFYHYAAYGHTLARIDNGTLPSPAELMGGQAWTDAMPALVFLCARFERSMWKYDDANAYRVVLIEAGHIGQNIMLAATRHGLTACPSAALNHSKIRGLIGKGTRFTHAPVYALAIGRPAALS